jgi:hypothetical protein
VIVDWPTVWLTSSWVASIPFTMSSSPHDSWDGSSDGSPTFYQVSKLGQAAGSRQQAAGSTCTTHDTRHMPRASESPLLRPATPAHPPSIEYLPHDSRAVPATTAKAGLRPLTTVPVPAIDVGTDMRQKASRMNKPYTHGTNRWQGSGGRGRCYSRSSQCKPNHCKINSRHVVSPFLAHTA